MINSGQKTNHLWTVLNKQNLIDMIKDDDSGFGWYTLRECSFAEYKGGAKKQW